MSPIDEQRVKYINYLMDIINSQCGEIYEGLVDKEFLKAESDIDKLILTLNDIKRSLKDEI